MQSSLNHFRDILLQVGTGVSHSGFPFGKIPPKTAVDRVELVVKDRILDRRPTRTIVIYDPDRFFYDDLVWEAEIVGLIRPVTPVPERLT